MQVLLNVYGLNSSKVEMICRMYTDTHGEVAGRTQKFMPTMGLQWGCPMSPLLFSLLFDRTFQYMQERLGTKDMITVVKLA